MSVFNPQTVTLQATDELSRAQNAPNETFLLRGRESKRVALASRKEKMPTIDWGVPESHLTA